MAKVIAQDINNMQAIMTYPELSWHGCQVRKSNQGTQSAM